MTTFLKRQLNLSDLLIKKSFFLFGPRGTGKSKLISHTFGDSALVINLLKTEYQLRLTAEPYALEEIIRAQRKDPRQLIVIDEIQKVPALLDEVHRLIEEESIKFLLTGSSARRLKQQSSNLLAGRAWRADLFPLVSPEIPNFDLDRYLRIGGLPAVWLSQDPEEQLDAYVSSYINEEIKAEGAIRKIPPFIEYLRFAALSSGQILNFSKIANDAGVSPPTISSYFEILEDTLLGFRVEPWTKSTKRKAVSTAKFYLFDTGVVNTLAGTKTIDRNSNLFGQLFENWIAIELKAYLSYRRIKTPLRFWRTESQYEVDFILGDKVAIECKSTKKISSSDLKGIQALKEEKLIDQLFLVSSDPIDRKKDGVAYLHWETFIDRLWRDEIIK